MSPRKIASFFLLSSFFFSDLIFAASDSQCSDVLIDGTKAKQYYQDNFRYKRLVLTRFKSATYEQAKTDKSITGNLSIGEFLLGSNFTEQQFTEFKNNIDLDQRLEIDWNYRRDILTETGDEGILQSWLACMVTQTGMAIKFKDVTDKQATLWMRWYPKGGVDRVKVKSAPELPSGVRVTNDDGKKFLNGKESIGGGEPVLVKIEFDDANTPLSLSLHFVEDGLLRNKVVDSRTAYLPTRMKYKTMCRDFKINDIVPVHCHNYHGHRLFVQHGSGTGKQYVYCGDINDGWKFLRNPISKHTAATSWVNSYPNSSLLHIEYKFVVASDDRMHFEFNCSNSSPADNECKFDNIHMIEEKVFLVPENMTESDKTQMLSKTSGTQIFECQK